MSWSNVLRSRVDGFHEVCTWTPTLCQCDRLRSYLRKKVELVATNCASRCLLKYNAGLAVPALYPADLTKRRIDVHSPCFPSSEYQLGAQDHPSCFVLRRFAIPV